MKQNKKKIADTFIKMKKQKGKLFKKSLQRGKANREKAKINDR